MKPATYEEALEAWRQSSDAREMGGWNKRLLNEGLRIPRRLPVSTYYLDRYDTKVAETLLECSYIEFRAYIDARSRKVLIIADGKFVVEVINPEGKVIHV